MKKSNKAPFIVIAVIALFFLYGMGSKWLKTRKSAPVAAVEQPLEVKPAETVKQTYTAGPTPNSVATANKVKNVPNPVMTSSGNPKEGSFPVNPYVQMMKQMGQKNPPPTSNAAPHPLDPNSPHPFMHPSQSDKLSKALDSIKPGQIEDKKLRKRNLYFEKLSQQLKELQGQQKNQEDTSKSDAEGDQGAEVADDLDDPENDRPEQEEEFEEEFQEEFQEEFEEEPIDDFQDEQLDEEFIDDELLEDPDQLDSFNN